MISKKIGIFLPKDTKSRIWWLKLGISLIFSNIFFFILFNGKKDTEKISLSKKNWVEIQLDAEILTPLVIGKKVLIVHKGARKKIEGILETNKLEDSGKITVSVREEEAHNLFQFTSWQILPYLRQLSFASIKKVQNHEIHY